MSEKEIKEASKKELEKACKQNKLPLGNTVVMRNNLLTFFRKK